MPFVPVPNTCSVEMIYESMGQKCENVFHASKINTFSASDLADICVIFADWFIAHGKALCNTGVALSKIVAKDISSQTGPAIEYTGSLPVYGVYTGTTVMPLNVTVAVSFGTNLRGRSYRGRIYQIGLTNLSCTDNQVSSSYRSDLITYYGDLVSAVSTGGFDLCVVSRFHNKAPRTTGVATPITSVSVDPNLDSQRRRLTGRGQ
jgi:hypothetical protein